MFPEGQKAQLSFYNLYTISKKQIKLYKLHTNEGLSYSSDKPDSFLSPPAAVKATSLDVPSNTLHWICQKERKKNLL